MPRHTTLYINRQMYSSNDVGLYTKNRVVVLFRQNGVSLKIIIYYRKKIKISRPVKLYPKLLRQAKYYVLFRFQSDSFINVIRDL